MRRTAQSRTVGYGAAASVSSVRARALRSAAPRLTGLMLALLCVALMALSQLQIPVVTEVRTQVADAALPVIDTLSSPFAGLAESLDGIGALGDLRAELLALREENERLLAWQATALRLEGENRALRALLAAPAPPEPARIAARVVVDGAGAYVAAVLVDRGATQGIAEGQPALSREGLVGRVVDVGPRSARILLITDISSRIPVLVESSRSRALLIGTNGERPRLAYLPAEAVVRPGDRIVTSGDGGTLPPGLPVGTVAGIERGDTLVTPLADLRRLEYVVMLRTEPVPPVPVEAAPQSLSGAVAAPVAAPVAAMGGAP